MADGPAPRAPEEAAAAAAEPLSGARVVDSPILLLVCFHKALRAELSQLTRLASDLSRSFSSSSSTPSPDRDSLVVLRSRYQFLHTMYKYHSAAEDEVIFCALDIHVGNVACTYSLEHVSTNDLFDSVFHLLDVLLLTGDNASSKPCQELALCSSSIEVSIRCHMLKEEEQVFPLMMQRFSFKEQASLVWQFICSVPITLLEDFLPWMMSYISDDEQDDVMHCLKEAVPKERLLQEVVLSWLDKKSLLFCGGYTSTKEKVISCLDQPLNLEGSSVTSSSWKFSFQGNNLQRESFNLQSAANYPIVGLHRWHGVIIKELKEILEELHELRSSRDVLSLSSASSRIMFIADILIFYSDALKKVIFPVINEFFDGGLPVSRYWFLEESEIEELLCVLQSFNSSNRRPFSALVEKLCCQLESFMIGITQHFDFQESMAHPLICKICDSYKQQSLLYNSIRMMPLGLLKSVIIWLSANLTEDELKKVLHGLKLAGPVVDPSFASLLHDWLYSGYSGKISLDIFRKELQAMFKNRSSFIPEQIDEGIAFDLDICKGPHHPSDMKASFAEKAKDGSISTSTETDSSTCDGIKLWNTDECSRSYSSKLNLQIFFSKALKKISSFSQLLDEHKDVGTSSLPEPKPIDHIFHFHKALEKDLEFLVSVSVKMVEDLDAVKEFQQRFHILQIMFQAHSTAEDEIAFPALEAKGTLQNISRSYTIDHKLEEEQFKNIAHVLDEISELHSYLSSSLSSTADEDLSEQRMLAYQEMCMKLHVLCKSMQTTLGSHTQREEIELWPLFLKHFSEGEQEKIIGCIIGRTRAEVLQTMIPWLMESLSQDEQNTMISSWRKATRNTMFDEWLGAWWEGMKNDDLSMAIEEQSLPPSGTRASLEVVAAYLAKEGFSMPKSKIAHDVRSRVNQSPHSKTKGSPNVGGNIRKKIPTANKERCQNSESTKFLKGNDKHNSTEVVDRFDEPVHNVPLSRNFTPLQQQLLSMCQEDLEALVRKVSHDPSLEPHQKSYLVQNLLMSRWIISQQVMHSERISPRDGAEVPGQSASYQDTRKLSFGCEHYKRNCKLLFSCCNLLFTCKYCHDNASDHSTDRKSTTKMMCMKCLQIQPIGARCSNISCDGLSMARYFCSICKLYDDEREIYHCPFCNLCRVGKGLGIDYFHCMNCNACMSKSLSVHICREKCFESNCPICHEYIFTSSSPVKALPCGHLMHSTCFQDYTCTHYTCPICSKSLGDMQVYFGMLDVLLTEEKLPLEYIGQTQAILCNDCEKKGTAPFHWLYHKCPYCGSYNTRLF